MKYVIEAKSKNHLIFHLHGTGGNAYDLLSIGQTRDPNATLIGLEGAVNKNGMLRFFKRSQDGSFDYESLYSAAQDFLTTFNKLRVGYQKITLIGYSNGANLLMYLLKRHQLEVDTMILFHPMHVLPAESLPQGNKTKLFITYGQGNPFITETTWLGLKQTLTQSNLNYHLYEHDYGHQLRTEEIGVVQISAIN